MAIVMPIGGLRSGPVLKEENLVERLLESPFFKAEMARSEMWRAEHPSETSEGIIDILLVWAVTYIGLSAYWIVKYDI
ncbi:hypothetical protein [Desulfoscipio geothermicus]|uniref:Uncharacterized protein n=1 Tax=Desulfoscipio geothermicus DSM 3669 TaxID=1121426 RepID=A0A1I6D4U7_9FIRM|nr:hypothetical protein [Desulfoscipio geothermicus]SFR00413.1 hypothetical protein SAMN05660706_10598 [Desulfoscipio geothermicus DSM 3669]